MFDGYDLSRYGFHLGSDIEIYRRALVGVLFSYTAPYVKSDLGRITANDYTAGIYFRIPTAWEVVANAMVGFGNQSYRYKNTYATSEFRGDSVFASIELARPFSPLGKNYSHLDLNHNGVLTPLIALDFQSASMGSFVALDPVLGGVLIEPGNIDSIVLRLGLLSEFRRFRTRVQYMRQLSGDDFIASQTSLLGDNLLTATSIRSTQWGKDWLNVGIGGELLATRHWRIFADYNFDLGKQTTSHLGSLNTIFRW
jgi:outer membrane autotransporter protein